MDSLTILGKSEAVVTMICDNLESNKIFPNIIVYNNLNLPIILDYFNPNFNITFDNDLSGTYILGMTKPENKFKMVVEVAKTYRDYINIIHKKTAISTMTLLHNGILINSFVSIAAYAEIGNHVTINRNSSIGHHTVLEDFVTINPGVTICGNVKIGAGTYIGAGCIIKDGVTIGKNCTIGMGSLVLNDLPDDVLAYGNPCRVIQFNNTKIL